MTVGGRRSRVHRPGRLVTTALACIALLVQVALAGRQPPIQSLPSGDAGLAALLGPHALCLAAAQEDKTPASHPSDPTPARPDHDTSGCCVWHVGGIFVPPAPVALEPVVFTAVARAVIVAATQPAPAVRAGAIGARAPPSDRTIA